MDTVTDTQATPATPADTGSAAATDAEARRPGLNSPEPAPKPKAMLAAPAPRQKFSFALVWLFIVLLVAAVSFGSVYTMRQLSAQQTIVDSLRGQLDQQQQALELQQRMTSENLEKEMVNQQLSVQSTMNDMGEQLSNMSARLLSLSSINRDEWKLQEAQYLLRLADQRLMLEQDSQNALALAISADDVLRDIDRADLMPTRKLLAEEIAVLKLAGLVDREGIFLRLAALANQIDAIPFVEPLGNQQALLAEEVVPENETFKQTITRKFYSLLHRLGSYVRVRDHGQAINAVLPPSEQKYLQQNLRLMLEQAQVALLRNEAQIYTESLVKAQNWINQYYTLNQEAEAVVNELQALQEEEVAPELTNFSNASAALAEYIDKKDAVAAARRGVRP